MALSGAAASQPLTQPALSAVGYAEGSVHEAFYLTVRHGLGDPVYLLQAQLAGQNQLGKSERGQPAGLLHSPDIALGRGVQLYAGNAHP